MNRQQSLDILQYNKQEAQKMTDRKKQDVSQFLTICRN